MSTRPNIPRNEVLLGDATSLDTLRRRRLTAS